MYLKSGSSGMLLSALLLWINMAGDCHAVDYSDGIAAVVDNEVITVYEILRQTKPLEERLAGRYQGEELQAKISELRNQAGERLVENELVFAEYLARQKQVKEFGLPDEFIESRLDAIVVRQADGDWSKFRDQLEAQNVTLDEFREDLVKQLAVQVMLDELVRRPVSVSGTEIVEFYQANPAVFTRPKRLRLALIFVRKNADAQAAVESKVQAVRERLEAGEEFAAVAKELSEDVSAEQGGAVGWIPVDAGRPEFVQPALRLKPGEFVGPLTLPEGVYYIQLLDREAEEKVELTDELRTQIEDRLRAEKEQTRYRELIQRLKKKFYVKSYF